MQMWLSATIIHVNIYAQMLLEVIAAAAIKDMK